MRALLITIITANFVAGRRDLAAFTDKLELLKSARQLPRIAPEKFVEVFALSATVGKAASKKKHRRLRETP